MRAALAAAVALLAIAPAASAQPTVAPWNGVNPFRCVLQQAGTGTQVPDPGADPYCVDFDKRHQNVTQLGVVDFLSKEPARVAAASGKCFYFQSDHWRGSIVQDNGATKTYEWDGHYFFDKARGNGGAWVTNFNIGGHTADPSKVPGMPASWARYMGPGTGGVIIENDIPVDPACAARASGGAVYTAPGAAGPPPSASPCISPTGRVAGRRLGMIRIGDSDARVRASLGDPFDVRDGFLIYCVRGGGEYLAGQAWNGVGPVRDEASAPTVLLLTTSHAYRARGVGPGMPARALRHRLRRARLLGSIGGMRVWSIAPGSRVIVGTRAGRVRFVAVYKRGSWRALKGLLRRAL